MLTPEDLRITKLRDRHPEKRAETGMKFKHTNERWFFDGASIETQRYCITRIEDDGEYAAPPEEREANGQLMAASPELLAACLATLGRLQNPMLDTSLFSDVKIQLRDAIILATSPSPT